MLDIRPFKSLRYTPKAGNMPSLVSPPYDVISPSMQQLLYEASPFNAVRLELPKEDNRYEIAKHRLESWLNDGILIEDSEEAVFPYYQTFDVPILNVDATKELDTMKSLTRRGMIVKCRIYDFNEGIVLPHEKTLPKAKADRLSLFKTTEANLSPIFGLYDDITKEADETVLPFVKSQNPCVNIPADYQGATNQIWRITDTKIIETIKHSFKNKKIYIADGHHRYETALAYREFCKEHNKSFSDNHPANFIMMYIANMRDDGMLALPTHRLVHSLTDFSENTFMEKLKEKFEITNVPSQQATTQLMSVKGKHAYGIVLKKGFFVAEFKESKTFQVAGLSQTLSKLNLTILHKVILEEMLHISEKAQAEQTNLIYSKVVNDAVQSVKKGDSQVAFILNPITIDEMTKVCQAHELMPQKSTFFFPKILTGITFYRLK